MAQRSPAADPEPGVVAAHTEATAIAREQSQPTSRRVWTLTAISLALFTTTIAVFWPVRAFPFLRYDDHLFVTQNEQVQKGLTPQTIAWALKDTSAGYWHPLPTLAHMAA